jgi:hypothetical protein
MWNMEKLRENPNEFEDRVNSKMSEENRITDNNTNEKWDRLKRCITEAAVETIGYKKVKRAKKPWVTDEMIIKMEERRKWKSVNTTSGQQHYRRLNNELRRVTDKAREQWWVDTCEEIEEQQRRGNQAGLYMKIRSLTRDKKPKDSQMINNKEGKLLTSENKIRGRWKEYLEELYNKEGKPELEELSLENVDNVEKDQMGPELLDREIEDAIKKLKQRKAQGCDNIPAELLQNIGIDASKELKMICKEIYNTGIWPEDFLKTVMIPIKKKPLAVECSDHRTISLITHASKIMLRILTRRLEARTRDFIGDSQFGFKKGCGTREAVGMLRTITERSLEHENDVYICFIDFEKAFDRVNWKKLMEILGRLSIDWKDRRLIRNLYHNQKVTIRIGEEESDPAIVGRGVRQGCIISPLLFSIYTEALMIEALEDIDEGVKVGGQQIKEIRFADDQAILASSEEGLQKLMEKLQATVGKYDMKMNIKKTKVMRVSRSGKDPISLVVDGNSIEQVTSFKYLGSIITSDGKCDKDIQARIAMMKCTFSRMKELMSKGISLETKKKIVNTLIWSIMLYGSESWTLRKRNIKQIDAAEMWLWRRLLRISWRDRITNEEVRQRIGQHERLRVTIFRRKRTWVGHVLRGNAYLGNIIEGRMEGQRPRGRPRVGMLDDLKRDTYSEMRKALENRRLWKSWMP